MKQKLACILAAACLLVTLATPVSAATIKGMTVDDVQILKAPLESYTVETTIEGASEGSTAIFFGVKGIYKQEDVTNNFLSLTTTNLVQIADVSVGAASKATTTFSLKEVAAGVAPVCTIFVSHSTFAAPKVVCYVDSTVKWGNVTDDYNSDPTDALQILRASVGAKVNDKVVRFTDWQKQMADVKRTDHTTPPNPDPTDALIILRASVGAKVNNKVVTLPNWN